MLRALLTLVAPDRCPVCSRFRPVGGGLCPACAADWAGGEGPPTTDGVRRFSPAPFEGELRRAVLALKFGGEQWRGCLLGIALARATGTSLPRYDVVAPVPLGRRRLARRGYNQSLELARGFATETGARLEPDLMHRVRETPPQSSLGAAERGAIRGAFVARACPGVRVLLIDDVTTTGETASACADAVDRRGGWVAAVVTVAAAELQ